MWSSRPYTFDRVVRIFFSLIVVCIILYFMYVLRHVLLPFCVACLVAYLIEPGVKWNQRIFRIKKHSWAVIIATLEALLVVAAVSAILIPIVEREVGQLATLLSHYMRDDHPELTGIPAKIHSFFHTHADIDSLIASAEKIHLEAALEDIWKGLTSGLDKILGIFGWLISVVYVIFILLDFDKYKNGLKKYIPDRYKGAAAEVMGDVSWTMKKYFRNQALISVIVGILYAIGFSIVGIPMAVVIGVTNIILFMVPYMVYLSLVPVTLMCLFHSMATGADFWVIWLECIAVYVFVEAFSDLFLTPKIMGKALGLDPAIILLSLSIWGTLLGLLGMVIALPVTTILMKWGKIWLTGWRNSQNAKALPQPEKTGTEQT